MSTTVILLTSSGASWRRRDRLSGIARDTARCREMFALSPAYQPVETHVLAIESGRSVFTDPSEVTSQLDSWIQSLSHSDMLVVVLSGHVIESNNRLLFELWGSVRGRTETYLDIGTAVIRRALFGSDPLQVALVLDCCFAEEAISGVLDTLIKRHWRSLVIPRRQSRDAVLSDDGRDTTAKQWVLLYATSPARESYEDAEGSVFLRLLCQAFGAAFAGGSTGAETLLSTVLDEVKRQLLAWAHEVGRQDLAPTCDGEWRRDLEPYVAAPSASSHQWVLLPLEAKARKPMTATYEWGVSLGSPGSPILSATSTWDQPPHEIETGVWSPGGTGGQSRTVVALGFKPHGLLLLERRDGSEARPLASIPATEVKTRGLRMSSDGHYLAVRSAAQGTNSLQVFDLLREQMLQAPVCTMQVDMTEVAFVRAKDDKGRDERTYLACLSPGGTSARIYSLTGALLWEEQQGTAGSSNMTKIHHLRVSEGTEPVVAAVDGDGVLRVYIIREPSRSRNAEATLHVDVCSMQPPMPAIFGQARKLAIRPDGAYIAVAYGARNAIGLWRRGLDSASRYEWCAQQLEHTSPVVALEFSSDGRWLASADVGGHVGLCELAEQGPRILTEPLSLPPDCSLEVSFSTLAFVQSAEAPRVAVGTRQGDVLCCTLLDNFWEKNLNPPAMLHRGEVFRVFSGLGPDGKGYLLVLARDAVELWRMGS